MTGSEVRPRPRRERWWWRILLGMAAGAIAGALLFWLVPGSRRLAGPFLCSQARATLVIRVRPQLHELAGLGSSLLCIDRRGTRRLRPSREVALVTMILATGAGGALALLATLLAPALLRRRGAALLPLLPLLFPGCAW